MPLLNASFLRTKRDSKPATSSSSVARRHKFGSLPAERCPSSPDCSRSARTPFRTRAEGAQKGENACQMERIAKYGTW